MNFNAREAGRRLFSPRIVIYMIMAVAAAWLMHRLDGYRKAEQEHRQNAAPEIQQAEALKPADRERLPLMIFFVEKENDAAEHAEIQKSCEKLEGKCIVMKLAAPPDNMKALYNVRQLPTVILFDSANKETARADGSVGWENLPLP